MKKNKKKLPRYWLGTRKPTGIGYLPNLGIGDATFSTTPGLSLTGEATAARLNILPTALGKLGLNALYPVLMLLAWTPLITTKAAQSFGTAGQTLMNTATSPGQYAIGNALKTTGENAATKGSLSTLGKAAGVLGTAYGVYNIYNDFANSGPGLSLSDIANTASVNTYTTAHGNTYTQHGGIDRNSILNYANAETTKNRLGLTMDAMGTGASIGGFFGPVGMGIGAGVGLLAGAAAFLGRKLGFGDNEDKYKEMMRRQEDVFAMLDRLSESVAKDKDTKAEFYNKLNKPILAKDGKLPCYSDGVNARVSNGEGIAKYANGLIYDLKRVPGVKNNEDTVETHLDKNDIVFSNKYGISDEAMVDPYSALARQTMLLNMGILGKSKNAKNGKLPSFWGGTTGLYLNVAVPSIFGIAANLARLNLVNNSDRTVPKASIGDFGANDVINETYADQINPMEYIKHAHDQYRQLLWKIQRDPGFGYGARKINEANAYALMLRQLADTRLKIDEANRTQRNSSRSMKLQDALNRRALDIENFWKSDQRAAQINAAYEKYRSEIPHNIYNILGSVAGNIGQIGNYNDSLKFNEKHLGLFEQSIKNDTDKVNAIIKNMRYNNYTPVIHDDKETDPVEWYNNLPWWLQNDYLRRSARAANLIISV